MAPGTDGAWRDPADSDKSKGGKIRNLTTREKEMAKSLFKESLMVNEIKVSTGKYLGIMPGKKWAIGVNNTIYVGEEFFTDKSLLDDFSKNNHGRHFFIHEVTHVWQKQMGYSVEIKSGGGALSWLENMYDKYAYPLSDEDVFEKNYSFGVNYSLEEQAELLSDYYIRIMLNATNHKCNIRGKLPTDLKRAYERVLKDFLANPADQANLPYQSISEKIEIVKKEVGYYISDKSITDFGINLMKQYY